MAEGRITDWYGNPGPPAYEKLYGEVTPPVVVAPSARPLLAKLDGGEDAVRSQQQEEEEEEEEEDDICCSWECWLDTCAYDCRWC